MFLNRNHHSIYIFVLRITLELNIKMRFLKVVNILIIKIFNFSTATIRVRIPKYLLARKEAHYFTFFLSVYELLVGVTKRNITLSIQQTKLPEFTTGWRF